MFTVLIQLRFLSLKNPLGHLMAFDIEQKNILLIASPEILAIPVIENNEPVLDLTIQSETAVL